MLRRRLAAAASAVALAWAGAAGAVGTPTWISPSDAYTPGSTNGNLTKTANGNCAAGNLAIAIAVSSALSGAQTFSDSAGNTWVQDRAWTLNSQRQNAWHAVIATGKDIVSGSTTFTLNNVGTGRMSFAVLCETAADSLDNASTGIGNAAATSSSTTYTPTTANSVLEVAFLWRNGSAGTWVEDTGNGWTGIAAVTNVSNNELRLSWRTSTATSTLTYAPSWGSSMTSTSAVAGYRLGGAAPRKPQLMTMGVGQ